MIVLAFAPVGLSTCLTAGTVSLTRHEDRVRVEVGGALFTEYVFAGATRPYCYPVLAADGTSLSRDFPMKETPGEDHDHPWHRALMFAHGNLNGIDFWNETGGGATAPKLKGMIVHDGIVGLVSGERGELRVRDRYVAPDGSVVCTDERTLTFFADGDIRGIDFEVTLHANADTPLKIGDTKEGTMAIRLAQWMTMPHETGHVKIAGRGHIESATGRRDGDVWGTRADWCDYWAERDGRIYGVAIFDHPKNPRHPTRWMARDYGLFAANPFGWHDFEPKATAPGAGDLVVPAGASVTLRYRFIFHFGDATAAHLPERYAEYVTQTSGEPARRHQLPQ